MKLNNQKSQLTFKPWACIVENIGSIKGAWKIILKCTEIFPEELTVHLRTHDRDSDVGIKGCNVCVISLEK